MRRTVAESETCILNGQKALIELKLICGVWECFKLKSSTESLCGNTCVNIYVKTFN